MEQSCICSPYIWLLGSFCDPSGTYMGAKEGDQGTHRNLLLGVGMVG